MYYKDLLDIAIETHIGNQSIWGNGEILKSDHRYQERKLYFKYLLMAEEELYTELAPYSNEDWAIGSVNWKDVVYKDALALPNYLTIKAVNCLTDFPEDSRMSYFPDYSDLTAIKQYQSSELKKISRSEMILLWQKAPLKEERPCFYYAENSEHSISVYFNIIEAPINLMVLYTPTYETLSIGGHIYENDDTIAYFTDSGRDRNNFSYSDIKISDNREQSKTNTELAEAILPDKYNNLLINGLLVYLYRNQPTMQANVKEQVAYKIWEEGKQKLINEALIETRMSKSCRYFNYWG